MNEKRKQAIEKLAEHFCINIDEATWRIEMLSFCLPDAKTLDKIANTFVKLHQKAD